MKNDYLNEKFILFGKEIDLNEIEKEIKNEKTLVITKEIHELWLDAEKEAANTAGSESIANMLIDEIGKAIYGENLPKVKSLIYSNMCLERKFDINFLLQFEVQK